MSLKEGLSVISINNSHYEKIASFLSQTNVNTVFQSVLIYELFQDNKTLKPLFLAVENDDKKILGLLLAIIHKEHQGLMGYFSSRSIIIGGPIVLNNDPEILLLLLNKYSEQIKRKVIYTQFRNTRNISSDERASFEKCGYKYEAHLDIIHDLTRQIEEQWMGLNKGRRKNIRRGEKLGLVFREIRNNAEFETAYGLVKETYKRVKLPAPYRSIFLKSYDKIKKNDIFKVFVTVLKGEIIATRIVLCYNTLIYDWIAGASEVHLNKYPNDFLPWKVMEWGSNNGFKYFDFGGAGKPNVPYGVRDHKLKFGGELVEFGRFEKIHNKLFFKIGKLGLNLYKLKK